MLDFVLSASREIMFYTGIITELWDSVTVTYTCHHTEVERESSDKDSASTS